VLHLIEMLDVHFSLHNVLLTQVFDLDVFRLNQTNMTRRRLWLCHLKILPQAQPLLARRPEASLDRSFLRNKRLTSKKLSSYSIQTLMAISLFKTSEWLYALSASNQPSRRSKDWSLSSAITLRAETTIRTRREWSPLTTTTSLT